MVTQKYTIILSDGEYKKALSAFDTSVKEINLSDEYPIILLLH